MKEERKYLANMDPEELKIVIKVKAMLLHFLHFFLVLYCFYFSDSQDTTRIFYRFRTSG